MDLLIPYLILWGICAVFGALVANPRNAARLGFCLGLVFGPVGVLIAAFVSGTKPSESQSTAVFSCPRCRRPIAPENSDVMTCPRCRELIPVPNELRPHERVAVMRKLVACPDCGHQVSRRAKACPQCGGPVD